MFEWLAQWWQAFKARWVGHVPSEHEVCEFECRKHNCSEQRWEDCPERRSRSEQLGD